MLRACKRHDFGYCNAKRADSWYGGTRIWRRHNKAVADWSFRRDMGYICSKKSVMVNPPGPRGPSWPRRRCYATRGKVYWVVSWGMNTNVMHRYTYRA